MVQLYNLLLYNFIFGYLHVNWFKEKICRNSFIMQMAWYLVQTCPEDTWFNSFFFLFHLFLSFLIIYLFMHFTGVLHRIEEYFTDTRAACIRKLGWGLWNPGLSVGCCRPSNIHVQAEELEPLPAALVVDSWIIVLGWPAHHFWSTWGYFWAC